MTFYEAAIEVLRRSGRPLHYKKITEVAIRQQLLSHVGKTPEETMGSRLEQEVKKEDHSWIVKTRPGVFVLREDVLEKLNLEAEAAREESQKVDDEETSDASNNDADAEAATNGEASSRRRRRRRKSNGAAEQQATAETPESVEDLQGNRYDTIADAALAVLRANGDKAMTIDDLADIIFKKKLFRFHTHDPVATVQSGLVTDNQQRVRKGRRPLFAQFDIQRWGLTEWGLSSAGLKREKQISDLADEMRRETISQLGEKLLDVKPEALDLVVMTLLERLDYRNIKVAKRTSNQDVFFTADWRRGFADLRVTIQLRTDAKLDLDAKDLKSLADSLEHYAATEGVVIHLGEVTRNAIKASRDDEGPKISVIDRKTLVRLLVDHGIGVKTFSTPITFVDTVFLEALTR